MTYEAFNTSGGLGTLAKSLEGKVRTVNYRAVRYPCHLLITKALLNDLNLKTVAICSRTRSRTRCRRPCRMWWLFS